MRLVLLEGSSVAMCEVCVLWPRAWPRVTKFVYFIPCTKDNIACAYLCLSVYLSAVGPSSVRLRFFKPSAPVAFLVVWYMRHASFSFICSLPAWGPLLFAVEGFGQYYSIVFLALT